MQVRPVEGNARQFQFRRMAPSLLSLFTIWLCIPTFAAPPDPPSFTKVGGRDVVLGETVFDDAIARYPYSRSRVILKEIQS